MKQDHHREAALGVDAPHLLDIQGKTVHQQRQSPGPLFLASEIPGTRDGSSSYKLLERLVNSPPDLAEAILRKLRTKFTPQAILSLLKEDVTASM